MRARRLATTVLLCAVAAVGVPSARAQQQPATPPADAKVIARQHFQRAKLLHENKQYAEAAAEYLEAYRHLPAPAFIYNAGQVFRLSGDKHKALEHYKKYLELDPGGEGAADARQFIAELSAAIEAEDNARRDALVPTGEAIPEGETAPRDTGERPGRTLMIAGAVSGGIGAAALVAAGVFALKARSAQSDLDGFRGTWTAEQQDRYASGEAADRNMTVSLAIGAAGLAAGGAMFFIGRGKARRAEEPPVAAGTDGAGAVFLFTSGRF